MLEKVMHGREVYEAGDVRTVDPETGQYFCACGWAKDVDGAVETGNRDLAHKVVSPDSASHANRTQEV